MIEYNKINGYIENIVINKYVTNVENTFGCTIYKYNVIKTINFNYNGKPYSILFNYAEFIKDINLIKIIFPNKNWVGFRVNKSHISCFNDIDRW